MTAQGSLNPVPPPAVVSAPAGGSVPRERGILFSAPMVRALLAGTKAQTRRADRRLTNAAAWIVGDPVEPDAVDDLDVEFSASGHSGSGWYFSSSDYPEEGSAFARCPYGVAGDRLWVRETHAQFSVGEGLDRDVPQAVAYRATCDDDGGFDYTNGRGEAMRLKVTKWTPAIFMPRWASRITLEVTGVRVERLQDITEEDARAEGVEPPPGEPLGPGDERAWSAVDSYRVLWNAINGAGSWAANPWVWVVEFRRAA